MNAISSSLPSASFAGGATPLRDAAAAAAPASAWLRPGGDVADARVDLHVGPGGAPLDLDAAERDFLAALCTPPSPQAAPFG